MWKYIIYVFLLFATLSSAFPKADNEVHNENKQLDNVSRELTGKTTENSTTVQTESNLDQNKINLLETQLKEQANVLNSTERRLNELITITNKLKEELSNCNNLNESLRESIDSQNKTQDDEFTNRTILNNKIQSELNLAKNEIEKLDSFNTRLILMNFFPTLCFPDDFENNTRTIKLSGHLHFSVLCDDSGWIVFQSRNGDNLSFTQSWKSYESGFGDLLTKEHFLGLKNLNLITTSGQRHELHILLMDSKDNYFHAHYSHFEIGNATEKYKIKSLGEYSGDAGDGLYESLGLEFKVDFQSGWWVSPSNASNLHETNNGIKWCNKYYKTVEMATLPVLEE